ncbi:hypothetical protein [Hymenobacter sp.]|jgi:hypothetical protein|uniref:hypothetical protein n=1 Tax=Hymenobacter sp. TaxID=1898978 RepID=UPI002ED8C0FE
MRKYLLVFLGLLVSVLAAHAQRIELDSKLKLAEPKVNADTTYKIFFNIKNIKPTDRYTVSIEDRNRGKATPGRDYKNLIANSLIFNELTSVTSFNLVVNKDIEKGEVDESIVLRFQAQKADTMLIRYFTFTITDADKKEPEKYWIMPIADTTYNSLKILTAASFDFFGKSQFKNFTGDLTVSMPELWLIGNTFTMGINSSIFNYNYYTADSTRRTPYGENVLIGPTTRALIADSTRFVRNRYNLESKTDIKTWGYNVQLLFGLNDLDKKRMVRSYYTLHLEGLSTQENTTYKKFITRTDTLVYTAADASANLPFTGTARATDTQGVNERTRAYFGVGYTTYVAIPKKFDFYGQGIIGIGTNAPVRNVSITDLPGGGRLTRTITTSDRLGFYLLKTRITEKFTKLNGTAGVEIRGNIGETKPIIAAYLGLQIGLDTFFKK